MKLSLPAAFAAPFFLFPAFAAQAAFSDVAPSHVNAEAITYVQSQGIVQGYADGTFKADQSINRAELTKIITLSLYGQAMVDQCGTHYFDDVPSSAWFWKYVCRARDGWLLTGYPDGSFRPEQSINFVEAAKILGNAFGLIERNEHCDGKLCPDTDTADHPWYEQYVQALAENNAIPLSVRRFEQMMTRGEMAEMIHRLHAKVTTKPAKKYEELAGITTGTPQLSSSSSSSRPYAAYPYTLPLDANWKDKWNFYIDENPVAVPADEGYNLLTELDLERVERVEEPAGRFPEFLRVLFPQGAGSFFVAHFYGKPRAGVVARVLGDMKPTNQIHLTYYVRFPTDFDFSANGVLPAIGGGITTSEHGAWGSDFFAGVYWNDKGELGISGNFDASTDISNGITGAKFVADGQWHRIDLFAQLNTVPVRHKNGILFVKYDGAMVFHHRDLRFRSREQDQFDSFVFHATIGALDTYSVAKHDMHVDLAGFTIVDNMRE